MQHLKTPTVSLLLQIKIKTVNLNCYLKKHHSFTTKNKLNVLYAQQKHQQQCIHHII